MDELDDLLARGEGGGKPKAPAPAPAGDDLDALLAKGEAAPAAAPGAPKSSFLSEVGERVSAPFRGLSLPTSLSDAGARVKQNLPTLGRDVGEGFAGLYHGAERATQAGLNAINHPIDTMTNPAARREYLRGAYDPLPFVNLAVDRAGGPPEVSPEDAAAAPGVRELGGFTGPMLIRPGARAFGAAAETPGAVATGLRGIGEGAIERSGARGPGAVKGAAKEALTHLIEKTVTGKIGKVGAVAADETAAAVARRILGERRARAAPVVEEAAAPPEPAASPTSDNPQIAALQEALKTATPAQAEGINQAIAGYEARAARPPRAAAEPPAEQLAPSLAERAAAVKEARIGPKPAPAAAPAPEAPRAAPVEVPKWEPSKFDDEYARKLKMPVEKYRAEMQQRLDQAHAVLADPAATPAARARAVQIYRGRTNVPDVGDVMPDEMSAN